MKFKRITDNSLPDKLTLDKVYDEIRMRDAEGHPKTYIRYGNLRLEFTRASRRREWIDADVRIFCEQKNNDVSCSS